MRRAEDRSLLGDADRDEDVCGDNPRSPLVFAVFITLCGAIVTTSPPGWLLMMAVSLFLMAACLRGAALESAQRRQVLLQRTEDPLSVDVPTSPDMLALLRSGRVVVLPRSYNPSHLSHGLADVERGVAAPSSQGQDRALLAQLAQHLSSMRERVQGSLGMGPMSVPLSEDELSSLPTCSYIPRTPRNLSAANSVTGLVGGAATGPRPHLSAASCALRGGSGVNGTMPVMHSDLNLGTADHAPHSKGGGGRHGMPAPIPGGPRAGVPGVPGGEGSGGAVGGGGAAGPPAGPPADCSELTCSICLEEVEPGEQLMTLPCLHQYHVACVRPWLQRQGRHAVCPLCKTPVFM